jgi:hypothetical protein
MTKAKKPPSGTLIQSKVNRWGHANGGSQEFTVLYKKRQNTQSSFPISFTHDGDDQSYGNERDAKAAADVFKAAYEEEWRARGEVLNAERNEAFTKRRNDERAVRRKKAYELGNEGTVENEVTDGSREKRRKVATGPVDPPVQHDGAVASGPVVYEEPVVRGEPVVRDLGGRPKGSVKDKWVEGFPSWQKKKPYAKKMDKRAATLGPEGCYNFVCQAFRDDRLGSERKLLRSNLRKVTRLPP